MKNIYTEFTNEINACEYNLWDKEETKEHIDNCVKIADSHALKFAEFSSKYIFSYESKTWYKKYPISNFPKHHTTKELLDIFKKWKN